METLNFSTENFFEPTEEFKKEFFDVDYCKALFNADLINIAYYYKLGLLKGDLTGIENHYTEYSKFFNVQITLLDVYETFKDYSESDFNNLVKYVVSMFKK